MFFLLNGKVNKLLLIYFAFFYWCANFQLVIDGYFVSW